MRKVLHLIRILNVYRAGVALILLAASSSVFAQSTNIDYPTPVAASEIIGMIAARDVGDPRLTRHYYILTGLPGDLNVTVESENLNGDVDVFTAGTLRPLTKLSFYAGLSTTGTTKGIYLRRRESLILRVEARSASDDAGRYRIRFSGSFEPVADAPKLPEDTEPTASTPARKDKNVRRVNAAGALIKEVEPEPVAATAPPEPPTPAPAPAAKTKTPRTAKPAPAKPAATTTPKTKPTRTARTGRTGQPPATARKPTTTARKKAGTPPAAPASTATTDAPAPATAEPVLNPRLIIETRDGMRVERYMSEVRRVTVEKGQLIVVTNDGKIERRPMTNVLRVTIEP